jgi:hypothetical protein
VNGLPSPNNDKRFVLALVGPRAVSGQTWGGSSPAAYLEAENATTGDRQYDANIVSVTTFNDRIAACPFQHTPASGPAVTLCN